MKSNTIVLMMRGFGLMAIFLLTLGSCARNDDGYPETIDIDPAKLPEASFTASTTLVMQDESVTFEDTSTKEPFLYTWEFEGGSPTRSTVSNPVVTYPVVGTFRVSLKVRNEFGAAEVVQENFITVEGIPIDPAVTVLLNLDDSLLNEGSAGGAAISAGTPAYATGVDGQAYSFDGTNNLTLQGYTGINGAAPRTVAAWVNTTSTTRETITHWGAQAIGGRASFVMNGSGVIRYEVAGGGINSVSTVNDGAWHHVAHTYDGSTVRLYIDGVEDVFWDTTIINTGVGGETDVEIGAQFGSNIFDGLIDQVYIYNRALSAAEILTLSQQ